MPRFRVNYTKSPDSPPQTREVESSSAESLTSRLNARYPGIEILDITPLEEVPVPPSTPKGTRPTAPARPSSTAIDPDDGPTTPMSTRPTSPVRTESAAIDEDDAFYDEPVATTSPSEPTEPAAIETSTEPASPVANPCIWAAKVELMPYSRGTLARLLLRLTEIVMFLIGRRKKGELTEFEDQICIRTTSWLLWIWKVEGQVTWIRKRSITGAGVVWQRGFVRIHRFVHLDYSSGSLSNELIWIRNVSPSEIDEAVERWIGRD